MPFQFDNTYAQLPEAFHRRAAPTPVQQPQLICFNETLAERLGLDGSALTGSEGLDFLAGNRVPEGADPLAMAYSGHQFGGFSPQLGDGRALLLGEVVDDRGERFDIQLKGSGPTPFSRRGDGRSALGPVLREYLVSEAMWALGVPTTRALAAVASGEHVRRDGHVPGGVMTRVASSHIRVGTFQWFAARRDSENLRILVDYVIDRHDPEVRDHECPSIGLLNAVVERQARLIAQWMHLGFIHGVMNTDNTAVSGETIDYGPCAFMDSYHPDRRFSSIDDHGRYSFQNQAPIALWNLSRFAETLLPLIDEDSQRAIERAEESLRKFEPLHQSELHRRFAAKIGIATDQAEDWELINALLKHMADGNADFTLVFRRLSDALESGHDDSLLELFDCDRAMRQWLVDWRHRMGAEDHRDCIELMRRTNPVYIPRNHRIEQVIAACYAGETAPFHQLHEVLSHPFVDRPEFRDYEVPPEPHEVVQATFCGT